MFPECSLQGVWNSTDGFTLTDPVVHHASKTNTARKHTNGATDKGQEGIENFFKTHKCNALCRMLGLDPYTFATGPPDRRPKFIRDDRMAGGARKSG
jgi:hypothetical protein